MASTFLFVEHFGRTDFICGADKTNCGCPMDSNVLDEIIECIPDDAVLARRVYFSMKMMHWSNQMVCTLLNVGTDAELAMYGKAHEFADICESIALPNRYRTSADKRAPSLHPCRPCC